MRSFKPTRVVQRVTACNKEIIINGRTFKMKNNQQKIILAICYDFDKTLSPDDMQAQGFIQSLGKEVGNF